MINWLVLLSCLVGATHEASVREVNDDCQSYNPPKHGVLACLSYAGTKMCQVYCQAGFDFAYRPAQLYYCVNRQWNFWPPFGHGIRSAWPDCAPRVDPSSGHLKMSSSYYYSGNCHDPEVQEVCKNSFQVIVSDPTSFPATFCLLNSACRSENVNIFCGESAP